MEDYYGPMDREPIVPIGQIGASTNPFQHQTEALKARIFHGANRVEFSFFGKEKANKEQPAPESFGKREREDMRTLAEYNKVLTSTHATVGVNGLSGFNQGNFSEDIRKSNVDELKRAIDFASEASTGGAVVFHTGEAPRSMVSRWKKNSDEPQFQKHPHEAEEEEHYLVDPVTQQMVARIKENEKVAFPIFKLDENGNTVYMKNEKGEIVKDDLTGEPIPEYEVKDGNIQTQVSSFKQFRQEQEKKLLDSGKEPSDEDRKDIIKEFFRRQKMKDIIYFMGQSKGFEKHYTEGLKDREKIIKSLKFYRDLKEKVPEEDWWKYQQQVSPSIRNLHFIPNDISDPVEYLEDALKANEKDIGYGREIALSGRRQAKEMLDMIDRSMIAEDYAHQKATESMTDAAMYALEKTEARARAGDKLIENNPLYISPESWQPEMYGGHPDELKMLVQDARVRFAGELKRVRGFSEKQAQATANKHIKATIDIGHLNTWRRFFVKKETETQEQYDKRFKNWVLDKTKDLANNDIVGHVHLSDNYGFHDEHLTIGDGNAPVKEFIEILKKVGVDDFIVEGGSFNPMTALPDSWAYLGSPVYSLFRPGITGQTWSDGILQDGFHQSYFGSTEPPRYIIGEYAPSEDYKGAPFYTGVPLE
ncbi:sugar phosphate isomerase/epimerase [Candidatus Woesearchaeota archaeon]|nr:sugar phosphate isomerase/epimerase [Candidatus Woesearchaeota archaeon]